MTSVTELRKQLREVRRAIPATDRARFSLQIAEHLNRYLPFRRASRVGFYLPLAEEADTAPAVDLALCLEKSIYLPVINTTSWRKGALLFVNYVPGQTPLKKNRFGINEPVHRPGESLRGTDLDVVCVPLVGFNTRCDRIGMGAGYYDRAFETPSYRQTRLVGLAFSCQQADFEPAPHDVPLSAVVTETGVIHRPRAVRKMEE